MSVLSPHAIFNCSSGTDQSGPAQATGDSLLMFLGSNLSPGSAAAALTVYDGPAGNAIILLTLAAPSSGGTANGVLASNYAVRDKTNGIHYTLTGTGATAQLYWQTG